MSQSKLLYELLSAGQDTLLIVEVAATIIANLELNLAKERRYGAKAHALPDDWTLPDEGRLHAKSLGWADEVVSREATKMVDWAKANGIKRVDWAAQWRNWCNSRYQPTTKHVAVRSNGADLKPSDMRVLRKERMSDAIRQLAFGFDMQQGTGGEADLSNVVRLPGPSRK